MRSLQFSQSKEKHLREMCGIPRREQSKTEHINTAKVYMWSRTQATEVLDELGSLCLSCSWWYSNARFGVERQYGHLHAPKRGTFLLGTHGKCLSLYRSLVSVLTNNPCYQRAKSTDHIKTNESGCI